MDGFLSKIKQYGLLSSIILCSVASSAKDFEKMAKKMVNKFSVPSISAESLQQEISKSEVVLLDARELSEYKVSHIKSAKYVGYDNFDLDTSIKGIPKTAKVIVYCSVGYRSGKIAEKIKKRGYNVYNLKGGIFDWVNKSHSIVDEKGKETVNIHGYNRSWAKWLKKGNILNGK